ncbi:MAG TPA: Eco57I restriction-modification methylase domain-containing protein [Phycisphaerales bacterium]|nr:Eco57I restriction-modification methylase domain-containing protein [Phycisphaerales bacterium]
MAKRPDKAKDGPRLFERHEQALDRRIRRQRALFIPKLLRRAAGEPDHFSPSQLRAHKIAIRWADLESSGSLAKHKETSIDTQFLDQLFGEGLGYTLKTQSPAGWQLEHKFSVKEVGTADAALAEFPSATSPSVVIELKDALTDLDRDKSSGRTAVQQCWDYLNALPDCPWGIVSNFSTIRLYHRTKGALAYEEFTLQELRDPHRFNDFYHIFERGGLLPSKAAPRPRAATLLDQTQKRQKDVGDDLYKSYQIQRLRLIEHLKINQCKPLDDAIRIAQKLLDRIIFIAFCEDRGLLPEKCLEHAYTRLPAFSKVTNPRWANFLGLFHAVDKGSSGIPPINAFNGGLFAPDPDIDELDLFDEPWTTGFKGFGDFDFSEEVNVEVLGHLFERSITELEKLRVGGLFALKGAVDEANGAPPTNAKGKTKRATGSPAARGGQPVPSTEDSPLSKMPKSAQRKRFGIYYTPPAFTGLIVERTVDALIRDRFAALAKAHKFDPEARENPDPKKARAYWSACLDCLKSLTICDPACGSGAFLIRAYESLDAHYKSVVHGLGGAAVSREELLAIEESIPDLILTNNLYGVDLSREGVEITQLALWIRSARPGKSLMDLSTHIVHGNSLVSDKSVDPYALDWLKRFPKVMGKGGSGGFDCIIGNPPWEQIMLHDREFFAMTHPGIAMAVNAADRDRMIGELPKKNPDLHAAYQTEDAKALRMLKYARESGDYPLTGKGRTNLYMCFAERAMTLVASDGLVGLLVPSGIATDDTTKDFFAALMDSKRLESLYDFENKNKIFEDVDGRFKFSAIVFGGASRKTEQADFVFFAHGVEDTAESQRHRHIALTAADMALLNPNTKTCPIFRSRRDADLTRSIYKRIPILIDQNRKKGGNPWGVTFKQGLFNQTSDSKKFEKPEVLKKLGYSLDGNRWVKGKTTCLPLYEAKMVQAFDHRAASIVIEAGNWMRQGQKADTTPVQHANPEFATLPRWWVKEGLVDQELPDKRPAYVCFKDVTSATNERTMIACFVPRVALVNSAPIVLYGTAYSPRRGACLLANFNSFAYDFIARQKVGGNHLNFFIVEQLPTLPPDTYADKCRWAKKESLEHWISERVLKLSCTAEDMLPLAKACAFTGSRGDGVHIWKDQDRAHLRAELDAAFFHLYAIERDDAEYMLSTFTNTGFIPADRRAKGDPAWETGSTGEAILDAYDALGSL